MGVDEFAAYLEQFSRIALDTSPIIYFVEANPKYAPLANVIFQKISQGTLHGFTSTLTLTEVLVFPMHQQLAVLQNNYSQLLLQSNNLTLANINTEIAIKAASLRAKYKDHNLRTPDALQLAMAIEMNCPAFITNDKRLNIVQEVEVIVLDTYL
jgi:predicted nucleic acid-binding protein